MFDNETVFKTAMIKSQDGDKSAYHDLLKNLNSFLTNYLKKRIFNSSEIEEVIQEILLAVHKSKHTYDSSKSFMSWFMSIVEYKIIDYIRTIEKNKKTMSIDDLNLLMNGFNLNSDLKIDIEIALNKLNSKEKAIFNLLKTEGQSVQQVAKEMNLTESNVKIIAHRAYINLKKILGGDFENN